MNIWRLTMVVNTFAAQFYFGYYYFFLFKK